MKELMSVTGTVSCVTVERRIKRTGDHADDLVSLMMADCGYMILYVTAMRSLPVGRSCLFREASGDTPVSN